MPDWPTEIAGVTSVMSTAGEGSIAADVLNNTAALFTTTAGAWTTANTAIFAPVLLRSQIKVFQMAWINGATVSGNLDVGIYDRAGSLIVSSGATAQGTLNIPQLADITDTTLAPGLYYLAMAVDNTTATYVHGGLSTSGPLLRSAGCAHMPTAYPLPATATFTGFGFAFGIPLLACATSGSVI